MSDNMNNANNASDSNSTSTQNNDQLVARVEEVLDKLRPYIRRDGGDVALVDIVDGVVHVKLLGACGSCPSSTITLKAGIERALTEEILEIKEVRQVL